MRDTFLGRHIARASRIAFAGGLVCLQTLGCSDKTSSTGDDLMGAGGMDTSGSGGDAQPAAGNANPAGTGGVQSAGGSAGSSGAAATGGAGGASAIVDAGPRVGKLTIMALGDSTTCCTCIRAELAKLLDKSHPNDYQYVGTENGDFYGCGGYNYDKHNQGMGGYLVTSMGGAMDTHGQAPTWAALKPDVVLLHFATNDAWNSISPTKILAAYTYLLGEFRKTNPRVTFLTAQLIPLDPMDADGGKSCAACPGNIMSLNAAIPAWATANNTATSRVIVVDQWTGYVAAVDNCAPGRCDGVHPGPTGSVKMAAKWDAALEPLF